MAAGVTVGDNGGPIVVPVVIGSSGRWLRVSDGLINVKWFGARGNGVADDTGALQSALSVALRGKMFLPAGVYRTTDSIVRSGDSVILEGAGINATTIFYDGPDNEDAITLRYPSAGSSVRDTMNSSVRDLRIEAGTPNCAGAGLYLDSLVFASVQNVHITGFTGAGGCGLRIDAASQASAAQDIYLASRASACSAIAGDIDDRLRACMVQK